jgi:nucleoid DNA-binding protein
MYLEYLWNRITRTGFNPKTQQKITIPAKTVVKFRVGKAAKDGVLGVKKWKPRVNADN